jgi:hypothetical protein
MIEGSGKNNIEGRNEELQKTEELIDRQRREGQENYFDRI